MSPTAPDDQRPLLSEILGWTGKGVSAISDQGLFALSNFAINILLARWLTPPEYGAFSLAFSIFLLVGTLHTGLLNEPMLVFASQRRLDQLRDYWRIVLQAHWLTSAALVGILCIAFAVSWALDNWSIAAPLVGLAVATPLILLQWLTRRMCYAILKPQFAAYTGLLYMPILLALTYILHRTASLTPLTAFLVMGFASGSTAYLLLRKLEIPSFSMPKIDASTRRVLAQHWSYGKWATSIQLMIFFSGSSYYFLIAIWAGLDATAMLKANMNLMLPILHGTSALGAVLLPTLVQTRDTQRFRQLVYWVSTLLLLLGFAYWVTIGYGYDYLMEVLYGDQRYTGTAAIGWALGLVTLGSGVQSVLANGLYALERPDRVFPAYAIATGVTLTVGLGLMAVLGVLGAVIGLALANLSATLVTGWFFYQVWKESIT